MHECPDSWQIGFVNQTQGLQRVSASCLCAHREEAVVLEIDVAVGGWYVGDRHIQHTDQEVEGSNQVREGREQLRFGCDKQQPGRTKGTGLVCGSLPTDAYIEVTPKQVLQGKVSGMPKL